MSDDHWNPRQYDKFSKERSQPFFDLVGMVTKRHKMKVADIGCGSGALTSILHKTLEASSTLGIDCSDAMLKEAEALKQPGLSFRHQSAEDFYTKEPLDLIFSNACLQWVPQHTKLFKKFAESLTSEGQLAIQVPMNWDYFTHTIAAGLAQESPYKEAMQKPLERNVLPPEDYAQLFYQLKFKKQTVRMQVYPHVLPDPESLIEWVKGSLLTYYEGQFGKTLFGVFLAEYSKRVLKHAGNTKPVFMPFKRLFLWGQK